MWSNKTVSKFFDQKLFTGPTVRRFCDAKMQYYTLSGGLKCSASDVISKLYRLCGGTWIVDILSRLKMKRKENSQRELWKNKNNKVHSYSVYSLFVTNFNINTKWNCKNVKVLSLNLITLSVCYVITFIFSVKINNRSLLITPFSFEIVFQIPPIHVLFLGLQY